MYPTKNHFMSNILGTDYLPETPPTQDEKNLAMVTHLLTFFSSFIAPLIIYVIKKNESHFVAEHARQALNFHISVFVLPCSIPFSIPFLSSNVSAFFGFVVTLSFPWNLYIRHHFP